jgi:sodium transport system permease protein
MASGNRSGNGKSSESGVSGASHRWPVDGLLLPLSALFSALCLALATFARSTKEGQYYLTPLLMVVMGLTMFCLSPAVEMTPLYSVIPVVNVALLLKGLLLNAPGSGNLVVYAVPVLISSIGYSMLALVVGD